MARAGLVGNFLTDLGDAVAARWRFDAGSLILSRPGWSRDPWLGARCQTGHRSTLRHSSGSYS